MADEQKKDDGVKRDKLDYRVGYVEGLGALLTKIQLEVARGVKNRAEHVAIEKTFNWASELRSNMIEKMRNAGRENEPPTGV